MLATVSKTLLCLGVVFHAGAFSCLASEVEVEAHDHQELGAINVFKTAMTDVSYIILLNADAAKWSLKIADRKAMVLKDFGVVEEVYLPVGEAIELHVTASDGEYPLFIPELDVDSLALPTRTEKLVLQPSKINEFRSLCTPECKTGWSNFLIDIKIVDKQKFLEFLN